MSRKTGPTAWKTGGNIPFKISKVNGWFFKRGEGYLTLRVRADGLNEKQILDLRAILSDIKAEEKICYTVKTGRDQTKEMNFTVKDLICNFFGILGEIEVTTQKRTFLQAMSLCYGIMEELDSETSSIYFENLRLNADGSSPVSRKIDSNFLYQVEKYSYINWVVSKESLTAIADMRQALDIAEKNGKFLRENLGPAIFRDYLMVYLYYMCLDAHTTQLEKQSREADNNMCVYPAMRTIRHLQQQKELLTVNKKVRIQKPYRGIKPYIFISYAHTDSKNVFDIINNLQSAEYRVWYDEGIDPGTEWDENIAVHVEKCGYFIALISENYLASSNCKDELNYARELEKPRLLIYLEDVQLPGGMRMRLSRLQAIHKNKYVSETAFMQKLFETKGLETCCEGVYPIVEENHL